MSQSKCARVMRKKSAEENLHKRLLPSFKQRGSVSLHRRIERIHSLASLLHNSSPWPKSLREEIDHLIADSGDVGLIWLDLKRSAATINVDRFAHVMKFALEHFNFDLFRVACHNIAEDCALHAQALFAKDPSDLKINRILQMMHNEAMVPLMAFPIWIQHLLWTGKESKANELLKPFRVLQPSHPLFLTDEEALLRPLHPSLENHKKEDYLETVKNNLRLTDELKQAKLPQLCDFLIRAHGASLKLPDFYDRVAATVQQINQTSSAYLGEILDVDHAAVTVVEKRVFEDDPTRLELLEVSRCLKHNFYRPMVLIVHDLLLADDAATTLKTVEALDSLYQGCRFRSIIPKIAIERALGLNPSLPRGPILEIPEMNCIGTEVRTRLLDRLNRATTGILEDDLNWALNESEKPGAA